MSGRPEDRLAQRGGAVELLRLPAALFGLAARARAALYERGWLPSEAVEAPVVSVGNLSAGGTGKTPMVAWLARELARRGLRPGIVSRGYGARAEGGRNDEARALAEELGDVPHVQDPDRVRGARALLERGVDVVLADDAFQHRRLRRDLDLVLVDATRPWGLPAGRAGQEPVCALLPRGLLREPPEALARADLVVITRTDQVDAAALDGLRARLQALAPGKGLALAAHRPSALAPVGREGTREPPAALAGRAVRLVSGLGNPEAFERSVRALGADVRSHLRFADHHAYAEADVAALPRDDAWVVTTTKDAVKLAGLAAARRLPLWALAVELELREGEAVLAALLEALSDSRARRERRALHEGLAG